MTEKIKVLMVEDNPVNARLLTVFLEEAGFDVIHASDGYEGLGKVRLHQDIGVILLDRMMPGMDGLDVLMSFRRGRESGHIPVIMLTAALSPAQVSDAKFIGAYACLPKPYNKDLIIRTIQEALGMREARRV